MKYNRDHFTFKHGFSFGINICFWLCEMITKLSYIILDKKRKTMWVREVILKGDAELCKNYFRIVSTNIHWPWQVIKMNCNTLVSMERERRWLSSLPTGRVSLSAWWETELMYRSRVGIPGLRTGTLRNVNYPCKETLWTLALVFELQPPVNH